MLPPKSAKSDMPREWPAPNDFDVANRVSPNRFGRVTPSGSSTYREPAPPPASPQPRGRTPFEVRRG